MRILSLLNSILRCITLSPFKFSNKIFCKPYILLAFVSALLLWVHACDSDDGDSSSAVRVSHIGELTSSVSDEIAALVLLNPHDGENITPTIIQGATIAMLGDAEKEIIKSTYGAGHTIVILDAEKLHIEAFHELIGEGINFSSDRESLLLAYIVRKEDTHSGRLLLNPRPSPILISDDDEMTLNEAINIIVSDLTRSSVMNGAQSVELRAEDNVLDWQNNPLQTYTITQNGYWGINNTLVNIYALHGCLDKMDHYVVTAEADWTPTAARFQSASFPEDQSPDGAITWHDNKDNCEGDNNTACRYINYPLSYQLTIKPPDNGTVIQDDAAPAASGDATTSYTSGFTFSINGTVNASNAGGGGSIFAGASWTNSVTTTVPPLQVRVGDVGNQGVFWNFVYCTSGSETAGSGECISHVQITNPSGTCEDQLGEPELGQTPGGKFSNAIQSVHWEAGADTRAGSTFDIYVEFEAMIASTDLFVNPVSDGGYCNVFGCNCSPETQSQPETSDFTFHVPLPSTDCDQES